jgi:DNA polymerase-3 subunit delta'
LEEGLKAVRFTELLGQERAKAQLRLAAAGSRLPHAYLFCGIEGCGRRTAARMLAASLNCERPDTAGDACGECRSCRKLARETHPDLVIVEPEAEARRREKGQNKADNKVDDKDEDKAGGKDGEGEGGGWRKGLQIKIGQVRELCRRLNFAPAQARVRVSVICPAGGLTEEASNALLKTLEEPPPRNLLILCCREANEVLPTIASRCQALSFAPLPAGLVRDWLVARGEAPERAERMAYLAGGSLSRAERWLAPEIWERRGEFLARCLSPAPLAAGRVLELAAELWPQTRQGEEKAANMKLIEALLETLKSCYRDALVLAAGGETQRLINRDAQEAVGRLAAERPAAITRRVDLVERAEAAIKANCDPQLALEVLFLGLAAV